MNSDRTFSLTRYIQNVISTSTQVKIIRDVLLFFLFLVLGLQNPVCILLSEHVSVWTSHISRAQYPMRPAAAAGDSTGHNKPSSGNERKQPRPSGNGPRCNPSAHHDILVYGEAVPGLVSTSHPAPVVTGHRAGSRVSNRTLTALWPARLRLTQHTIQLSKIDDDRQ